MLAGPVVNCSLHIFRCSLIGIFRVVPARAAQQVCVSLVGLLAIANVPRLSDPAGVGGTP